MPRFDGTGPNGQGPRTGRGLGPCEVTTDKINERRPVNPLGTRHRPMGRMQRNRRGNRI